LIGLVALLLVRIVLALCHYRQSGGFPFYLSSAETLRVILSAQWARAPRWNVDVMWLPGAFWVYGAALRLCMRPLVVVPLINTLFTLGTVGCLFFLTELLTGSAAMGLGAAAYAAFQAESLVLGTGGSADPLLHLTVAAGILCWVRWLKGGRFSWMLAACALIAAGGLVRYEAWLAAIGLAVSWIREWPGQKSWSRRLAPLIVLALSVLGWVFYQAAHGEALQFLKTAAAAHNEDFERMSVFERFLLSLGDLEARPLLWLGRLLPACAWLAAFLRKDGDRAWRRVLMLGLWIVLSFTLLEQFVEIYDLHVWLFSYLAAPFVPWFVARALSPFGRTRRRVALALCIGLFLARGLLNWWRLTRRAPAKAAPLGMAEAIKSCLQVESKEKILIEAFPRRRSVPEHLIQQGLSLDLGLERVLLDRVCDITSPGPCSEQPNSPSVLRLPAGRLSPWLVDHKVVVIAASADDPPAAAEYEPVLFGDYAAFVAPGRPALASCLAERSFGALDVAAQLRTKLKR
jgi:hypothetical protein